MNLGTKGDLRVQLRRGATAVAAARVAVGVLALARPGVPSRPWVGVGAGAEEGTAGLAARVLGRALGGRDLSLGVGALAALTQEDGESSSAWVAAGALCDALDVATTLASWRELPRVTRWFVLTSAGGASLVGAAGAVALRATRAAG
ncbi:MAG TPA: hypothetical protein VMC83_04605 [Streptosporangiaceae bacterium]|nr:hypothetical protein [Streptosporangiaceae bacterium]